MPEAFLSIHPHLLDTLLNETTCGFFSLTLKQRGTCAISTNGNLTEKA